MRHIALDVHRDFCEVAVWEEGAIARDPRLGTSPAELRAFAATLRPDDQVVLEATGSAWAIADILAPHAGRVVLAHPRALRAIGHARAKTDRLDARTLVRLSAAGFLPEAWVADPLTLALRRQVIRRRQLVGQRVRAKNQVHAILQRNLAGPPPVTVPFGPTGRRWIAEVPLPADERRTVEGLLRELDFVSGELRMIEAELARAVVEDARVRRLMTVPGVNAVTAVTLIAAIGDVHRFASPRQLTGYLGLDPRVRQSGNDAARHGHISKEGSPAARHALVEAAWSAARVPGPLHAFAARIRSRRGSQVASVAVARKLACLAWHLLSKEQDYAYARPSLTAQKLRRLELAAGAPRRSGRRGPRAALTAPQRREQELELARRAEEAYERLVADWKAAGAGATRGRASVLTVLAVMPARQASEPQALPFGSSVTRTRCQPSQR